MKRRFQKPSVTTHLIAVTLLLALLSPLHAVALERDTFKIGSFDVLGPVGGDVRVIAIDPRDENHILASTLDGQVHKSTDGGKTWSLLVNLNQSLLVLDQLSFDVENSQIIYASGHRHKEPGGFFKSTDGGRNWKISKQLAGESVHAMAQSSKDPNILFAGVLDGVFASYDRGDSWKKITKEAIPTVDSLAVDPRDSKTIYAGTWWRAYKTTDGGESWKLIKKGMIDDSDVFAIDIDPANPDHIIASACSGIYDSQDGGEQWKKIQGIPSQSRRTRDIRRNLGAPGTVYAGTTEGFWMTSDGGTTWKITTGKDIEINSIAVHPNRPNRVFLGTNNFGIMVSEDGGKTFNPGNGNFTSRFAYTLTADVEKPNRLYATTQNTATGGGFAFYSQDGGATWTRAEKFDFLRTSPTALYQDRLRPENIYMATGAGILRSVNRGVSWAPLVGVKQPAKPAPKTAKGKKAVKVAPGPVMVPTITERVRTIGGTNDGKNGLLAGTDKGLYRTYDPTKGWEKLSFGAGLDTTVVATYVNPSVPERIFIGTTMAGVLLSKDSGKTWSRVDSIPKEFPISSIAGDAKNPERVLVGTLQTLYVSRDGGVTFSRRGGNLPLGNFTSILVNPRNSNEVFVSSASEIDGGIYFSSDAGWNWRRVDSKDMRLPSRRIWALAFDPSDPDRIFAGTQSSGVYRINRGEVSGETIAN